jgi:TonB family protein
MIDFLIYDLKVAVLIAVFYMFYRLLLAKETFHRVNRIVLLLTAVASFILPFCIITMHETVVMPMPQIDVELGTAVIDEDTPQVPFWQRALPVLFITGMMVTLANTLWSMFRIINLIKHSEQHPQDDGTTICVTGNAKLAPFSWMRYIVMNRNDYEIRDAAILTHERGHIRLHHSWDLILVDTLTALQWFNPAIWMLRNDLRAIHEYEADGAVLSQGINARQYQYLLITKAGGIGGYSLANGITHSALKNRITMMTNKTSKSSHLLKLLALLPIVGVTLALNAETVTDYVYNNDEPQKQVPVKKGKQNATIKTSSGQDIQIVEAEVASDETSQASDVETFTIKGKVFDGEDKSPIPGAIVAVVGVTKGSTVQVVRSSKRTVTDKEGNFRLEVAVGDRIAVTYAGYENYQIGVSKAYAKDRDYAIALYKEGTNRNAEVFDVVEVMPQYPGGIQELFRFLSNAIKYPVEAEKAGTQGRVIVTFVVKKDGSISDAHIVKSVDPLLDEEALRVINAMPNWEPGTQNGKPVNVKYTVPISFRLDGKKSSDVVKYEGTVIYDNVRIIRGAETPLVVVDDKTIEFEKMKDIDPKSIEKMTVLKDKAATDLYGDKAKHGAIVITTKK